MARTLIAPTVFVRDGGVADPAGTTIDSTLVSNGAYIASPGPWRILLRVANTAGAAKVVTVRAGGSPAATATPVPYAQATVGDLTVSVALTSGVQWIGPLTTNRFSQADGSLFVDFASGTTGAITAFLLPYNLI